MLDLIKALVNALKLDEATQSPLIVASVVVFFAWTVYSKAQQVMKEERDRVRSVYYELYSPALGLLQCRAAGRITPAEFHTRFRDLLIAHRSKANPECLQEMGRWLRGEGNEPELEYCVDEACASALTVLQRTQAGIWATVWWLLDTYQKVVKLLLAIGVVAMALWGFVYTVERHFGKVMICVMVLTISAEAFRHRRQAQAARIRQARIAEMRERKSA